MLARFCRAPLGRGVKQTDADRYVKRYPSVDFALSLICLFAAGIDSLRQLREQLVQDSRLSCCGAMRGISNAQLPRLLQDRPSGFWAPLIVALLSRLEGHRCPSTVRLMDTSFFTMAVKRFSQIHGREFKPESAGIKLGMVTDPGTGAPVQWDTRVGQGNDIDHVASLIPPDTDIQGLTYVFDRGFLKLDFYADLIERGAEFVTRATQRVRTRIIDVAHLDPAHPHIVADHTVLLGSPQYRGRLRRPIRQIAVKTNSQILTFWASNLYQPAHEIADLYRQRWQIEITFRWIKRVIGCIKPLGYSQNAAEHTLYAAIVTYLITLLLAQVHISPATQRPTPKIKLALTTIRTGLHQKPTRQQLQALDFI